MSEFPKSMIVHPVFYGVALGVFWKVWGLYGFWWGLWYGLFWQPWVGYLLAEYLLR